jgi:hypothetical protein
MPDLMQGVRGAALRACFLAFFLLSLLVELPAAYKFHRKTVVFCILFLYSFSLS